MINVPEVRVHRPTSTSPVALAVRLVAAFVVGAAAPSVLVVVALGIGWGSGGTAAVTAGLATAVAVLVLAVAHRATAAGPVRSSAGWALAVVVVASVLVAAGGLLWAGSGQAFGPRPAVWSALGGIAFMVVAGAGTRTSTPWVGPVVASVLVLGVVVVARLAWVPVPGSPEAEAELPADVSLAMIYVTEVPGYDAGGGTPSRTTGSAILYQFPAGGDARTAEPARVVLLETMPREPGDCGRPATLLTESADVPVTCEELEPGVFHRSDGTSHQVVRVMDDLVVSAGAELVVDTQLLRDAVVSARPATPDDAGRLFRGWRLGP